MASETPRDTLDLALATYNRVSPDSRLALLPEATVQALLAQSATGSSGKFSAARRLRREDRNPAGKGQQKAGAQKRKAQKKAADKQPANEPNEGIAAVLSSSRERVTRVQFRELIEDRRDYDYLPAVGRDITGMPSGVIYVLTTTAAILRRKTEEHLADAARHGLHLSGTLGHMALMALESASEALAEGEDSTEVLRKYDLLIVGACLRIIDVARQSVGKLLSKCVLTKEGHVDQNVLVAACQSIRQFVVGTVDLTVSNPVATRLHALAEKVSTMRTGRPEVADPNVLFSYSRTSADNDKRTVTKIKAAIDPLVSIGHEMEESLQFMVEGPEEEQQPMQE